jgi:hypothetical protein
MFSLRTYKTVTNQILMAMKDMRGQPREAIFVMDSIRRRCDVCVRCGDSFPAARFDTCFESDVKLKLKRTNNLEIFAFHSSEKIKKQ